MRQSAMQQCFPQTLIRIFQLHIFADSPDSHFTFWMVQSLQHIQPRPHIRRPFFQVQSLQNLRVQQFLASSTGTS